MKAKFMSAASTFAVSGLAGCIDMTDSVAADMNAVNAPDTQARAACVRDVRDMTGNTDVVVQSSAFSEAGTEVILLVDGVLPSNGDYRIQVFINRNAARRNESTNYSLNVSIGGTAPDQDYADGLSGGPDFWEVFGVSQSLNVRAAPSTNAQVVMGLLNGTIVRNLGCRRSDGRVWCQVSQHDGGVSGWAASQYLREAAGPSAQTGPAVTSGNVMRVAGVPTGDVLNVRSGPGTGNPIVGALANGDPARVTGCKSVGNTRWCEIEMITDMREQGWVAGRYLSETAATAPSSRVSPAEQACLRAVTVETNNPDVVLLSSSFSQAGTEVMVGVGPQRAPWQCIAYTDSSTSRPMSMRN